MGWLAMVNFRGRTLEQAEDRMKKIGVVVFSLLLLSSALGYVSGVHAAEQYPVKPIILILPIEAGADSDILVRPLAQKVSVLLGKPVIIVNKPGAAGNFAYREIHDAKPNGYTIGVSFSSLFYNKMLGTLPYDEQAFTIIDGLVTIRPMIVGSAKTKRLFKTIEEVFSFAKSNPGEVSIATSGKGYLFWFAAVGLQDATGLKFNIIPQPGGAGFSTSQVAGGHVDLGIMTFTPVKSQVQAGNIRPLAIFGSERVPAPNNNVPCLKELGYDVNIESPVFLIGPSKLPKDIVDEISKAFETAANDREYKGFLLEQGIMPSYESSDKVVKKLNNQRKIIRGIAARTGILKE